MQESVNTPGGLLVRLKNKICLKLNIDTGKLKFLIDRFIQTELNSSSTTKTHYTRINMFNEFSRKNMTIKVFFKFLKVIGVKNVKITMDITTASGKVVTVSEDFSLLETSNETGEAEENE